MEADGCVGGTACVFVWLCEKDRNTKSERLNVRVCARVGTSCARVNIYSRVLC